MNANQDVPGTKIAIRMPNIFKQSPFTDGKTADGKPVDPKRMNPQNLPGIHSTFEEMLPDDKGANLAFNCYVGMSDIPWDRIGQLQGGMDTELKGKLNLQKDGDWVDETVNTPLAQTVKWKKIRYRGEMEFLKSQGGQESYVKMNGILDIYVYGELNAPLVIIAWRVPADLEAKASLNKWQKLTAGCVTIKP
jgi:hypothetical protein